MKTFSIDYICISNSIEFHPLVQNWWGAIVISKCTCKGPLVIKCPKNQP
jgi:hypothetical protein